MDKQHMLREIRRIAAENGGKAPGIATFREQTRVTEKDLRKCGWPTWGAALKEAGFEPNKLQKSLPDGELLNALATLTRQLNRFPTEDDQQVKRHSDFVVP